MPRRTVEEMLAQKRDTQAQTILNIAAAVSTLLRQGKYKEARAELVVLNDEAEYALGEHGNFREEG